MKFQIVKFYFLLINIQKKELTEQTNDKKFEQKYCNASPKISYLYNDKIIEISIRYVKIIIPAKI